MQGVDWDQPWRAHVCLLQSCILYTLVRVCRLEERENKIRGRGPVRWLGLSQEGG